MICCNNCLSYSCNPQSIPQYIISVLWTLVVCTYISEGFVFYIEKIIKFHKILYWKYYLIELLIMILFNNRNDGVIVKLSQKLINSTLVFTYLQYVSWTSSLLPLGYIEELATYHILNTLILLKIFKIDISNLINENWFNNYDPFSESKYFVLLSSGS